MSTCVRIVVPEDMEVSPEKKQKTDNGKEKKIKTVGKASGSKPTSSGGGGPATPAPKDPKVKKDLALSKPTLKE